jgi:RNA polymerase sigma factor (sigma-70 family)
MNTLSISADSYDKSPFFSTVHEPQVEKVLKKRANVFYTDKEFIAGLKTQNVLVIKEIYKKFYQQIKYLIRSNSGTEMDAEDIFQDALVVIYQKISSENFKLSCSFYTFLYSICRHLWLQRLNKREFSYEYKDVANLDEWQDNDTIEELTEENEKYKLFQQHFLRLNQNDQKVLKLFMKKIPLKEIALIMGFKSEKYAKFRKYLCKEKLKNSILNDPHFREIYQNEPLGPVLSC